MSERKVLGRGISSIIPTIPSVKAPLTTTTPTPSPTPQAGEMAGKPLSVSLQEIVVNPRQPRKRFSEGAIEELAQSIRQVGVLQPLVVRRTERGFELIAGERRYRAAKKAGLTTVPVVIRQSSDLDQLEVALIENLQRENLNPIEEALGYQRLSKEFGLTQEQISEKVGKDRSTVANLLRLLNLSQVVQEMLSTGALSMGHARALLVLTDARRQEVLAHRVEKEQLSVRQVEHLVKSMSTSQTKAGRRTTDQALTNPNLRHLSEEFQRALGTKVDIVSNGKSGSVRIHFFDPEDLRRISDFLLKP